MQRPADKARSMRELRKRRGAPFIRHLPMQTRNVLPRKDSDADSFRWRELWTIQHVLGGPAGNLQSSLSDFYLHWLLDVD